MNELNILASQQVFLRNLNEHEISCCQRWYCQIDGIVEDFNRHFTKEQSFGLIPKFHYTGQWIGAALTLLFVELHISNVGVVF